MSSPHARAVSVLQAVTVVVALAVSAPLSAINQWHFIDQITKVTVQGNVFFVQGTNPHGNVCVDQNSYYGTLVHESSDPGHSELYSMALLGYTLGKGMACYITEVSTEGVCHMTNCHLL